MLGDDSVARSAVASAIANKYDFRHINLGGLMTDELIAKTSVGKQINTLLKSKRSVPTDLVVGLLKEAFEKDAVTNFIIDGFPASVDELASLEKALGVSCDAAVLLSCNKQSVDMRDGGENAAAAAAIAAARGGAGVQEGVINYLRDEGKLVDVDGTQAAVEDILADVEGAVLTGNFKPRSKKVFVLGSPGSGKGTQCKLLVERYGFIHLSPGDLLRAEVRSGSPHGAMISEMIRQGRIVPAEITVGLLKDAMDKSMGERFLIDGFPRDMRNVVAWEKSLGSPEMVLFFECPEEEMERRLLKRGQTSGRSDDNAKSIKKRFKTFVEQSIPVISYYEKKSLVKRISAVPPPPKVAERVAKHFTSFTEVPDIIFVLGGPGSGKGTQCMRIANEYGFVHLSAGDLLRAEIQCGSKDGALIAGMIRDGKIVPQEITIRLLRQAMDARPGCRFLIDGFPRAVGQAAAFEEMVGHAKMVLFFDAADEILTERLLKRGETSGRTDDNAAAIKKRLVTYHTQSEPVITMYETRGMVRRISAVQSPDAVFNDVEKALAQFRKQQIILVLGPPLAGKTSLCRQLSRTGMFQHMPSSDLLKAEVARGTELGKKISEYARAAKSIPPEITVAVLKQALDSSLDGPTQFLVDGFPRKELEANLLAEAIGQPFAVLCFNCGDSYEEVMLERYAADPPLGSTEESRPREIEGLQTRRVIFEEETSKLARLFESRGVLKHIDAVPKGPEGELLPAADSLKAVWEQARTIFGI